MKFLSQVRNYKHKKGATLSRRYPEKAYTLFTLEGVLLSPLAAVVAWWCYVSVRAFVFTSTGDLRTLGKQGCAPFHVFTGSHYGLEQLCAPQARHNLVSVTGRPLWR